MRKKNTPEVHRRHTGRNRRQGDVQPLVFVVGDVEVGLEVAVVGCRARAAAGARRGIGGDDEAMRAAVGATRRGDAGGGGGIADGGVRGLGLSEGRDGGRGGHSEGGDAMWGKEEKG